MEKGEEERERECAAREGRSEGGSGGWERRVGVERGQRREERAGRGRGGREGGEVRGKGWRQCGEEPPLHLICERFITAPDDKPLPHSASPHPLREPIGWRQVRASRC